MTTTPILPTRSQSNSSRAITTSTQGSTLADILERVLDKGIVIAGDISVSIASTELLHIRIRLLISSVDKAKELGINWWENDPYLSSKSQRLVEENQQLQQRLESLEAQLRSLTAAKINNPELFPVNAEDDLKSDEENVPLPINYQPND
ncbi:gas vesicle protein [Calothrix sp. FACHB-156]|nr:gas vesicle protein [Nostoc linckia FACHB-104]MBD2337559.1 gas vesicle protein [Calothrix sp. FACHB-156]